MSDDPPPGDADSGLYVSPVVVVSHTFPARPGSLPDAELFVREALAPMALEPAEGGALYHAITEAMLAAAGPDNGAFDVTVRIFPDGVEVEVLHGAARSTTPPRVGDEPFADWLPAGSASRSGPSAAGCVATPSPDCAISAACTPSSDRRRLVENGRVILPPMCTGAVIA
jgi:hypothetical protein